MIRMTQAEFLKCEVIISHSFSLQIMLISAKRTTLCHISAFRKLLLRGYCKPLTNDDLQQKQLETGHLWQV